MNVKTFAMCIVAASVVTCAGCRSKAPDQAEFRYALDDYYRLQPHCLWSNPVNFPADAEGQNQEQAQQYSALTHAGVLERLRGPAPSGSGVVDQYNLSATGRQYWTADPKEPGWGNFCFGRPQVASIDSVNPPGASVAYTIAYRYSADLPGWANTSAVKSAFPQIATEGNGTATATLVRAGTLWQVQNVRDRQ